MLVLAMTGKKALGRGGFDKVLKMIDEMVEVLSKEQADDDDKKEYCSKQFDTADDEKKALERTLSDEESAIATSKESIATLTEEIAALEAGIKALDKSVAEATAQRKQENSEYKELKASDTAAKELLSIAKNRLNKFYNPKMYKAPPKSELSAEDRLASGISGTEPPTTAPGGIAGTGVTALLQLAARRQGREAPAPPPATWDAYAKKSEESTGVIEMIDLLVKDLDKEMQEAEVEEKNSQEAYDETIADAKEKRTEDSKSLKNKGASKADLTADLETAKDTLKSTKVEAMVTAKFIGQLHGECDWLLQYFAVRAEARSGEIDALGKAKAVLSGADYSLLQARSAALRGHGQ